MIPDFQSLMLPVLKSCGQGTVQVKDVIVQLAKDFGLTDEEKTALVPSAKQTVFSNRLNWAKTYLKQAGLIRYPARTFFEITDAGMQALESNSERIDIAFLRQYDSFLEFQSRRGARNGNTPLPEDKVNVSSDDDTPDEILHRAYVTINNTLANELLERIRNTSPQFFEELIIDLLLAMGYGGTEDNAGRALGRSGDDGVDGVIDQDPLGLDQVYVQAKRYKEGNSVGSAAIRDFIGALSIQNAQKGIFITSSSFSQSALETSLRTDKRIILIDGQKMTRLMIEYSIGCREEEVIRLKKIDEDFFDNEAE